MSIRIRALTVDEHATFNTPILDAFGLRPHPERTEAEKAMPELDVRFGAFDGPKLVGAAGAFNVQMSTPGGSVATSGLTRVAVSSTHRRQGILRALMRRHLDDARARQQPVAALWASEGQIYGRFGYGLAVLRQALSVERDRSAFAGEPEAPASARALDEDEAVALIPPIYEQARRSTPGMLSRSEAWWRIRRLHEWSPSDEGPLHRVILSFDGVPEAYVLYRLRHRWDELMMPTGSVSVLEAIGVSPRGTRAAWRFLFDIDLMKRIEAQILPTDHPLLLLATEPRRLGLRTADAVFLRVLDVPAALAARGYGADHRLTMRLADEFYPDVAGTYTLERGVAKRSDDSPDLALHIRALGSVYLGGFTWRQLAEAGQVSELREGAIARADALFRADRAPWCPEVF